uniref:Uncharacterized protein n=1 Tax=Glossina pallidipes TaxID=7398 RepID=A0A1A9ZV63_GLOPL
MKFGRDRDFKRLLYLLSLENSVNDLKSGKISKASPDNHHIEHEMESAGGSAGLRASATQRNASRLNNEKCLNPKDPLGRVKIIETATSISDEYLCDLSSSTPSASCIASPPSDEPMKVKGYGYACTSKRDSRGSSTTASFFSGRQYQALDSSNLVDVGVGSNFLMNLPTKLSQGTCTIHEQNIDSVCQTILLEVPQVKSKEIQANLSTSSSLREESDKPRSSDYNKSPSNKLSTSLYRGSNILSISRGQLVTQSKPHFIDDIMRRSIFQGKYDQDSNNVPKVEKLQVKFQEPLEEPFEEFKEVDSIFSTDIPSSVLSIMQNSPELDLGIQLICLLINNRCATKNEKKKLVRDIVKRITRLSGGGSGGFDPFRHNKLKSKLKGALLTRHSSHSETRSNISCDSVTQQLEEAQAAKIITPSNTVLAGSREIHSNQAILSSVCTGSIVFTNPEFRRNLKQQSSTDPEFQRNLKQQSSTDTVENEKLISVGIYKPPTTVSQMKESLPMIQSHPMPMAEKKTLISKSTSTTDIENN